MKRTNRTTIPTKPTHASSHEHSGSDGDVEAISSQSGRGFLRQQRRSSSRALRALATANTPVTHASASTTTNTAGIHASTHTTNTARTHASTETTTNAASPRASTRATANTASPRASTQATASTADAHASVHSTVPHASNILPAKRTHASSFVQSNNDDSADASSSQGGRGFSKQQRRSSSRTLRALATSNISATEASVDMAVDTTGTQPSAQMAAVTSVAQSSTQMAVDTEITQASASTTAVRAITQASASATDNTAVTPAPTPITSADATNVSPTRARRRNAGQRRPVFDPSPVGLLRRVSTGDRGLQARHGRRQLSSESRTPSPSPTASSSTTIIPTAQEGQGYPPPASPNNPKGETPEESEQTPSPITSASVDVSTQDSRDTTPPVSSFDYAGSDNATHTDILTAPLLHEPHVSAGQDTAAPVATPDITSHSFDGPEHNDMTRIEDPIQESSPPTQSSNGAQQLTREEEHEEEQLLEQGTEQATVQAPQSSPSTRSSPPPLPSSPPLSPSSAVVTSNIQTAVDDVEMDDSSTLEFESLVEEDDDMESKKEETTAEAAPVSSLVKVTGDGPGISSAAESSSTPPLPDTAPLPVLSQLADDFAPHSPRKRVTYSPVKHDQRRKFEPVKNARPLKSILKRTSFTPVVAVGDANQPSGSNNPITDGGGGGASNNNNSNNNSNSNSNSNNISNNNSNSNSNNDNDNNMERVESPVPQQPLPNDQYGEFVKDACRILEGTDDQKTRSDAYDALQKTIRVCDDDHYMPEYEACIHRLAALFAQDLMVKDFPDLPQNCMRCAGFFLYNSQTAAMFTSDEVETLLACMVQIIESAEDTMLCGMALYCLGVQKIPEQLWQQRAMSSTVISTIVNAIVNHSTTYPIPRVALKSLLNVFEYRPDEVATHLEVWLVPVCLDLVHPIAQVRSRALDVIDFALPYVMDEDEDRVLAAMHGFAQEKFNEFFTTLDTKHIQNGEGNALVDISEHVRDLSLRFFKVLIAGEGCEKVLEDMAFDFYGDRFRNSRPAWTDITFLRTEIIPVALEGLARAFGAQNMIVDSSRDAWVVSETTDLNLITMSLARAWESIVTAICTLNNSEKDIKMSSAAVSNVHALLRFVREISRIDPERLLPKDWPTKKHPQYAMLQQDRELAGNVIRANITYYLFSTIIQAFSHQPLMTGRYIIVDDLYVEMEKATEAQSEMDMDEPSQESDHTSSMVKTSATATNDLVKSAIVSSCTRSLTEEQPPLLTPFEYILQTWMELSDSVIKTPYDNWFWERVASLTNYVMESSRPMKMLFRCFNLLFDVRRKRTLQTSEVLWPKWNRMAHPLLFFELQLKYFSLIAKRLSDAMTAKMALDKVNACTNQDDDDGIMTILLYPGHIFTSTAKWAMSEAAKASKNKDNGEAVDATETKTVEYELNTTQWWGSYHAIYYSSWKELLHRLIEAKQNAHDASGGIAADVNETLSLLARRLQESFFDYKRMIDDIKGTTSSSSSSSNQHQEHLYYKNAGETWYLAYACISAMGLVEMVEWPHSRDRTALPASAGFLQHKNKAKSNKNKNDYKDILDFCSLLFKESFSWIAPSPTISQSDASEQTDAYMRKNLFIAEAALELMKQLFISVPPTHGLSWILALQDAIAPWFANPDGYVPPLQGNPEHSSGDGQPTASEADYSLTVRKACLDTLDSVWEFIAVQLTNHYDQTTGAGSSGCHKTRLALGAESESAGGIGNDDDDLPPAITTAGSITEPKLSKIRAEAVAAAAKAASAATHAPPFYVGSPSYLRPQQPRQGSDSNPLKDAAPVFRSITNFTFDSAGLKVLTPLLVATLGSTRKAIVVKALECWDNTFGALREDETQDAGLGGSGLEYPPELVKVIRPLKLVTDISLPGWSAVEARVRAEKGKMKKEEKDEADAGLLGLSSKPDMQPPRAPLLPAELTRRPTTTGQQLRRTGGGAGGPPAFRRVPRLTRTVSTLDLEQTPDNDQKVSAEQPGPWRNPLIEGLESMQELLKSPPPPAFKAGGSRLSRMASSHALSEEAMSATLPPSEASDEDEDVGVAAPSPTKRRCTRPMLTSAQLVARRRGGGGQQGGQEQSLPPPPQQPQHQPLQPPQQQQPATPTWRRAAGPMKPYDPLEDASSSSSLPLSTLSPTAAYDEEDTMQIAASEEDTQVPLPPPSPQQLSTLAAPAEESMATPPSQETFLAMLDQLVQQSSQVVGGMDMRQLHSVQQRLLRLGQVVSNAWGERMEGGQ
ncbi:hypothetical protein BGW41_000013 [Actinomortierella wolfii]|nr:hypothetical protein BGW41_000013 [Actinomortierella wolfii]